MLGRMIWAWLREKADRKMKKEVLMSRAGLSMPVAEACDKEAFCERSSGGIKSGRNDKLDGFTAKGALNTSGEVKSYLKQKNANPVPIKWQFTHQDARVKLHSIYPLV
jgi:hypothetical protein|tara:strand:+ start:129 stop:452 length:324 start_codon:yes stop_codon:yes gene_type:complete